MRNQTVLILSVTVIELDDTSGERFVYFYERWIKMASLVSKLSTSKSCGGEKQRSSWWIRITPPKFSNLHTHNRGMLWALYWGCEAFSAKGERNCTIMNLFERAKAKKSPNTTNINPKKRTAASSPSLSRTPPAPPSRKESAENERTRKNVICDNILKKSDAVPNRKKREQRERWHMSFTIRLYVK